MIMRAYRVDKIRRIEERAIAAQGVDTLMQRAAAAVAAERLRPIAVDDRRPVRPPRDDHGRRGQ